MMKYFIIINPNSGIKKSVNIFNSIISPELNKRGHTIKFKITDHQYHAKKIIQKINLKNKDAILVLGGDGTMHEVINGMLNRSDGDTLPIGLVTGGTGNSFMHDLNATTYLNRYQLPSSTVSNLIVFKPI